MTESEATLGMRLGDANTYLIECAEVLQQITLKVTGSGCTSGFQSQPEDGAIGAANLASMRAYTLLSNLRELAAAVKV